MKAGLSALFLILVLASPTACRKAGSDADGARARGLAHLDRGKYDLAIQEFDGAIAKKPDDADAYNSRGNAYAGQRELDRAIQNYDSAIALRPNSPFAYTNRGTAYASKGELDRAGQTGAYTVVWLHVAKMRLGLDDAAEFAANSARVDSASWPGPVIAYFDGKLTADKMVAATASAEERLRSDQRCGAEFFAGQAAMWKKQPAEARMRFDATRATCSKRYTEHAAAVAELGRLGAATK